MAEDITKGVPIGQKFASRSRTVSEGEFMLLQALTWQTAAIHTDKEFMKTTQFGERIMSGSLVLSVAMGLEGTTDEREVLRQAGFRGVAQLGIESVQFRASLQPGDTVRVEAEILEARPTRNPGRVVVKRRLRAFRQTGEMIMEGTRFSLLQKEGTSK